MVKINKVIRTAITLLKGECGQGLMEYSLVLVLISIAAVAMMTPLGARISALFSEVAAKI